MLSYKGIYVNYAACVLDDSTDKVSYPVDGQPVATNLPLARIVEGRLLSEWWETHPAAGPPDGLVVDDKPIPKPQLRVCTWNGECPEVIPECAMKFTAG